MTYTDFDLPDAVQWAEGMLLTPQHFQQHDIHWGAVLQQRLQGVSAYHWGIQTLQMDMPLIGNGTIEVKQLSCIFPDGTPFVLKVGKLPAGESSPTDVKDAADASVQRPGEARSMCLALRPDELTGGKSMRICIAMPPRTGAMQVQSTSIKRYASVLGGATVIDEMTGQAGVYVDRIRPIVELYREHEIPAGYVSLPLIEVRHNVQSAKIEPTSFHPPMLRLGASSYLANSTGLQRALKKLRDMMWDKLHELTGMASSDGPERVAAMSPEERMQLGLARNIASSLPSFDAIILDDEVAPVQAYRALAQVVGSMAWVGSNPAPLVMQPYTHENCAPQFLAAIKFVSNKLDLINTDWESLAFNRMGELAFARRLPETARGSILIEVRMRDGAQTAEKVEAWLKDARVGTEDLKLMRTLNQLRLPPDATILSPAETAAMGLRSDAVVVRLKNQKIEVEGLGLVDSLQAGRALLIQSNDGQLMPSAVILQHRRIGDIAPEVRRVPDIDDGMGIVGNDGGLGNLAEEMDAIDA